LAQAEAQAPLVLPPQVGPMPRYLLPARQLVPLASAGRPQVLLARAPLALPLGATAPLSPPHPSLLFPL